MPTTRAIRRSIASILLLGGTTACAAVRMDNPNPFVERVDDGTILLTVDNQDYRDATIYVDWNGVRQRVGMVVGKTNETFTTAWRDYQVRLQVDFIGGGEMKIADPITVSAGEHIDFVIMPGW